MCDNHVHRRDLQTSINQTSRLKRKQVARQQETGQVSHRAGGHNPRSKAVGARQEATSEAKDYLTIEVNKVDIGKEATAFVFTALLLEGEPEVQHPTPRTTHLEPLILCL